MRRDRSGQRAPI